MKNKKLHIWVALAVVVLFVCLAVFGCGEDIKGIRDMRFGIDIRGGVEAVFEPSGLKTNQQRNSWKWPGRLLRHVSTHRTF